jgi:hypothetical protein
MMTDFTGSVYKQDVFEADRSKFNRDCPVEIKQAAGSRPVCELLTVSSGFSAYHYSDASCTREVAERAAAFPHDCG